MVHSSSGVGAGTESGANDGGPGTKKRKPLVFTPVKKVEKLTLIIYKRPPYGQGYKPLRSGSHLHRDPLPEERLTHPC